ncbi:MAG: hypothetical protein NTX47_00310 [Candidatus Omnitrophica bacterium]|nr:hypothetical protein [Candidatus Omnitrophota bacterium]
MEKIIRFDNRSSFAKSLQETYLLKNRLLIGIDGDKGSGKTNLSYFLGAELMINVINLDDFTESNRGCFIDAMDLSRLEIRIKNLNRIGSIIIE